MPHIAKIDRKTTETDISVTLNLDGIGQSDVGTGIGFLDLTSLLGRVPVRPGPHHPAKPRSTATLHHAALG